MQSLLLDFPIILGDLEKAGVSAGELAKATGYSRSTLSGVKTEIYAIPKEFNAVATILDLWFKHCPNHGRQRLPVYGEHNE